MTQNPLQLNIVFEILICYYSIIAYLNKNPLLSPNDIESGNLLPNVENQSYLNYILSATRSPTSVVEYPILPAPISLSLLAVTSIIADSTARAAFSSPR